VRALVDGEAAFTHICEAVETARQSVWATVAYLHPDFVMPGARGSFFDVLDRAQSRGIDVRVIFWRTDSAAEHFFGTDKERAILAERGSRFLARWDRAQRTYCQHQKSWLIDAGQPGEIAFVGGINLNPGSLTAPGHAHRQGAHTHDVYCALRGPSATDVHHNFVQRWNEASERARPGGVWPQKSMDDQLAMPTKASPKAGDSVIQIQRTVRAGHYTDGMATPGGAPFDIANGEKTIFDQYLAAIDAARETIYIEDQYIASPDIVMALHRALERGVDIAFLCPAEPEDQVKAARHNPIAKPFFDLVGSLGGFDNFLLAGIASPHTGEAVYVHDKIMLVDDVWCTIGSCNIASQSFHCDTELNAAIWDADFTHGLRTELLAEHIGIDTSAMTDREAQAAYRGIARANASARKKSESLSALAFALDPARYAE
jgi:phosphatidylserine/phosphatidylglycerophosphate/cardiolipin synthase-like enzyme